MVTTLDTELIPEVLALVAEYGKQVDITLDGVSTYDPETGHGTQADPTVYTPKVTPPEHYQERFINGETIKAGDAQIWLPASGLEFTPVIGMKVTFDDQDWTVVNVSPIYTGDQVALYGLQIRQAG